MASMVGRPPAGNVVNLTRRLDAVEAENRELRQYAGVSRSMIMSAIVALARVEVHVGLDRPRRKAPAAGQQPLKMVALDLGFSESGLKKRALRDPTVGSKIGGRWFIDASRVQPKR